MRTWKHMLHARVSNGNISYIEVFMSKTLFDNLERTFQKLELEVDESLSKIRDTDVPLISSDPAAIDRVNNTNHLEF